MSPVGPFYRAHGTMYWICEYDMRRQECDDSYSYCEYHGCEMPIQNALAGTRPRCNAQWLETPGGGLFTLCSYHRCKEPTCGAPAALDSRSEYCRAHTCHATAFCREGVSRTKSTTNQPTHYCGSHKCGRGDCADLRATTLNPDPKDALQYRPDGSSMGYGYRQFCPKHACLVGCLDLVIEEGAGAGLGYCLFHLPSWENAALGD